MTWLSVKDYAAMIGVSARTVRNNIAAGKYQVKEMPHPSRSDQVSYLISAEAECGSAEAECGSAEAKCGSAEATHPNTGQWDPDWLLSDLLRARGLCKVCHQQRRCAGCCFTCERNDCDMQIPCEVVKPWATDASPYGFSDEDWQAAYDELKNDFRIIQKINKLNDYTYTGIDISEPVVKESLTTEIEPDPVSAKNAPTDSPSEDSATVPTVKDYLRVAAIDDGLLTVIEPVPDLRPRAKEVPLRYQEAVNAKVVLITQAIEAPDLTIFHQSLSHGLLCTEPMQIIGKMPSLRTLYRWISDYKRDGVMGLCPQHASDTGRGRKVPEDVRNKLLKILLSPNQVAVATAVNIVRDHYRVQKKTIGCSYRTMLRWVEDWKTDHLEEWTMARHGMKAYREKVNRTVLRDWTLTNVGDALITDGHVIEVMLIDPRDGKPKKQEIVAWFDAASRMPVGAAINHSENTEVIQLSFRNALLYTGYKPLIVYMDNGKAYKSKYFHGSKKNPEDIEIELQGVFARLGIETIFSIPYNAKSKIIERWWLDLQNQVERLLPGWTGNHNQNKPANMMRDEKWQKKVFPHQAITVDQFKQVFEYWAINICGAQPHPDYPEKTKMQVFEEGSALIPHGRRISPEELNHLLMVIEKKRITNQGITLNKTIYWDETLVGYVGRDLIVRWDFWDIRSILVYDEKDQFICQAPMRRFQDPLVKLRGDESIAKRSLEADLKEIKSIERRAKSSTNEILRLVSDATNDMVDRLPMPEVTMINESPLMPCLPQREETLDERISRTVVPTAAPEPEGEISEKLKNDMKSIGLEI